MTFQPLCVLLKFLENAADKRVVLPAAGRQSTIRVICFAKGPLLFSCKGTSDSMPFTG